MGEFDMIVQWGDEEAALAPEADRPRVKAEYVGAAIADSMFCQSCGARGYVDTCPRCSRCE